MNKIHKKGTWPNNSGTILLYIHRILPHPEPPHNYRRIPLTSSFIITILHVSRRLMQQLLVAIRSVPACWAVMLLVYVFSACLSHKPSLDGPVHNLPHDQDHPTFKCGCHAYLLYVPSPTRLITLQRSRTVVSPIIIIPLLKVCVTF